MEEGFRPLGFMGNGYIKELAVGPAVNFKLFLCYFIALITQYR